MNDTQEKHAVIREIARGTGLLSLGEATAKFFSLLSFIVLLRFLAVAEYGTYRLVFAAFGALYLFTISGINSFMQPDLAYELGQGNRGRAKALFRNFAVTKIGVGLVLFLTCLLGAHVIEGFYSERIAQFLRIVSPLFLINTAAEVAKTALAVDRNFTWMTVHNVAGSFFKFLLAAFFVAYLKMGVLGAILASFGSLLIPLLLIFPAFLRTELMRIRVRSDEPYPLLQSIQRHGKWAIFDSYVNGLGRNLGPLIIKLVLGTEAVAVFGVADTIVAQGNSLSALRTVLVPIVPREIDNPERASKILSKGSKYSILFSGAIAIALAVFVPLLITYGFPQYSPYIRYFEWMLIMLIPLSLGGIISAYYATLRLQRFQFFFTLGQTLLEVSLLAVLGRLLGMPGLVIAYITGITAYQLARLFVLFRSRPNLRFRLRDILTYDEFDRYLIGEFRTRALKLIRRSA